MAETTGCTIRWLYAAALCKFLIHFVLDEQSEFCNHIVSFNMSAQVLLIHGSPLIQVSAKPRASGVRRACLASWLERHNGWQCSHTCKPTSLPVCLYVKHACADAARRRSRAAEFRCVCQHIAIGQVITAASSCCLRD